MQNIFRCFVWQVKFFKQTPKTSGIDTKPVGARGSMIGPPESSAKMVVLAIAHRSGVFSDWMASIRGWNDS